MKNLNRWVTAVLMSLLLVSIAVSYLQRSQAAGDNLTVEIYKNNQLYRQIPLSEATSEEIRVADADGHYNVVEIAGCRARVREADCPNQICVNTGWLNKPGQISFCAPHKLKVVITGKPNRVDAISY